ncbi:glycoside hydrolase family 25 protein [Streptococcus macacae]|uniref:Glycosyl hydrolase family 25 n=1 Tax=Streptococcus macacae NCTC 11558 TaxID=764298 RepID=G5JYP1_9STRE|nr:glycoside hydrolase family 25 protein [Streptococcus macacae]EHJ52075.1 glycosyl hydrolase family 25 [Streptococcus macacae NCTC 11558]SUN78153.1 endolysin [Streptococcus macacae NCTC 11558]
MRRRIKPVFVLAFFSLFIMILIFGNRHIENARQREWSTAKKAIPETKQTPKGQKTNSDKDSFTLNPIIDVSGWQLPSEINYDTLSKNISGAIVRVQGGSGIAKKNNAAHKSGIDKSFKTHIEEFQKRNVPVAVYAYVRGSNIKEMKEEARTFYKNASPYNPTFYWLDVEEKTMSNMDKGIRAFRDELKRLGADNVGIYIGTYFMEEHSISTKGFDAIWIPTYGSDSGYFEAVPKTKLNYELHQYTSQGHIEGFHGEFDLNQIAVNKDTKTTYEKLFGSANK